jgi:hypothetical protein
MKAKMDEVEKAINPFWNMRTSTIKDQDPTFTFADKQAIGREGFNVLTQYDAKKMGVNPAQMS